MDPHGHQPVLTDGAPFGDGEAVMIMVHGRNAGPRNILDLVPHLAHPTFTYLAPAASGNTWYPYSFMTDTVKNEPGLSSALRVLDDLVARVVARGIGKDRIALLGFSQGACLTGEYAVRHAGRFGGILLFSGGLIGPPGTTWNHDGAFDGTPVFLGCSDVDPHIPKERVEESTAVFTRMGADVTMRLFPGMGHMVNDEEIAVARTIMDGMIAPAR